MTYSYEIQRKVGEILGRETSCLGKKKYQSVQDAEKAKQRHNDDTRMHHKVDKYECSFCYAIHLGRAWHVDDIRMLFTYHLNEVEKECYLDLLKDLT